MAIKANPKRRFKTEVTVWFPGEDGRDEKGTLVAHFKMASKTQLEDCIKDGKDLLDDVLDDVDDVMNAEGEPVQGDEAVKIVLEDACVRHALWQHYIKKVQSRNVKAGN